MKIFKEKEVRRSLLNKLCPEVIGGRGGHQKGWIILDGKKVFRFRIPNEHKNDFSPWKARHLAQSIGLNLSEFCALIDCSLKGSEYYDILQREPARLEGRISHFNNN